MSEKEFAIDDPIIVRLRELGGPITRDRYISLMFFGTPPEELTAEEAAEVPDYPWDEEDEGWRRS